MKPKNNSTQDIAMRYSLLTFIPSLLALLFIFHSPNSSWGEVGGVSGSSSVTLNGTSGAPNYLILTISASEDVVYTGVVSTTPGSDDNNISFSTSIDEDNTTINPFVGGAFNFFAQVPELAVSAGGGTVSSISVSYNDGFDSTRGGFANAPEIFIDFPDGGGDRATATATVSSGEITGVSITSGGSSYTSTPQARVIGGPHLVRIIDENSQYKGRYFLIKNNSETSLELDFSRSAETDPDASTYFSAGTLVEIIPATTLGSYFGITNPPTGWASASSRGTDFSGVDSVFVWVPQTYQKGYIQFYFVDGTSNDGWFSSSFGGYKMNNQIIYPDEGIIIAKRGGANVTFEISGSVSSETTKLYLPEEGNQIVINNPAGMDLLLAELIPSTSISTSDSAKFRAGTSNSDTDADYITFLSGSTWKTFWYKEGINDSVTSMMKAGAKAGTGGSNAITSNDLFIGSGTVTALQSCSDSAGSSIVTNCNDGNYTKVTISGTVPSTGFSITLSDIQGYMLSDDGGNELLIDASTGESSTVDTNGSGSVVYSNLIGSHEIVGSGSGYVVIEKQRDVNFKSDEGSPSWNVRTTGSGYSQSAKWWAVGGGGSNASGTVTTGGSFSVTNGGSGYTSAPQIVISGGGWRYSDDSSRGGDVLGKNEGVIIVRDADSGVKSFLEPTNPNL